MTKFTYTIKVNGEIVGREVIPPLMPMMVDGLCNTFADDGLEVTIIKVAKTEQPIEKVSGEEIVVPVQPIKE